jgi:hypothetical protein
MIAAVFDVHHKSRKKWFSREGIRGPVFFENILYLGSWQQ